MAYNSLVWVHVCDFVYICLPFTSLDSSLQKGKGLNVCLIQFIQFGSRSNAVIYIKFSVNKFVELMNGNLHQKNSEWTKTLCVEGGYLPRFILAMLQSL